jgi:hypothetical protein
MCTHDAVMDDWLSGDQEYEHPERACFSLVSVSVVGYLAVAVAVAVPPSFNSGRIDIASRSLPKTASS